MVKLVRGVVVSVLICLCSGSLSAQFDPATPFVGSGSLQMNGTPEDYITGGRTYSIGPEDGTWGAFVSGPDGGVPTSVRLSFDNVAGVPLVGSFWGLDFGVDHIPGAILQTGTFTDAQRASFADEGHPGIDVSGDGRGCNTIAGQFTITAFEYDCIPSVFSGNQFHLTRFAATFEQHCEGGTSFLRGTVNFTAPATGTTCDGSGDGGDTGGDTPTPPPPPPPFQIDIPAEFWVEPVSIASASSRSLKFTTSVNNDFNSDLNLSVATNASPTDDFTVEISPAFIAAPGAGESELTIRTGPLTFPRTYTVTVLGIAGEEVHGSSFQVKVECTPPSILGVDQPINVVAPLGSQGELHTLVSGSGPFFYQWYQGFPGMTRQPVTSTGPKLLANSGSGSYWLRVRNACGSFDSQATSVNP